MPFSFIKKHAFLFSTAAVGLVAYAMAIHQTKSEMESKDLSEPVELQGECDDRLGFLADMSRELRAIRLRLKSRENPLTRYLTREVYDSLKQVVTGSGFTLSQAINLGNSGNEGEDGGNPCGLVAGDEESYELFAGLFGPLITEHHGFYPADSHYEDQNVSLIRGEELIASHVVSCRMRVRRSIKGFPFPCACTPDSLEDIEQLLVQVLKDLEEKESLVGKIAPKSEVSTEKNKSHKLLWTNRLFKEEEMTNENSLDQKLAGEKIWNKTSNNKTDWNQARYDLLSMRSAFLSPLLTVVVNGHEHLEFFSLNGKNPRIIFSRVFDAVNKVQVRLKEFGYEFMWHHHYGYLVSNPQELGTSLRISFTVALPLLAEDRRLPFILRTLRLEGRDTDLRDLDRGTFEVANIDRLGQTEVELVQHVIDAVYFLIQIEKALAQGKLIDGYISQMIKMCV